METQEYPGAFARHLAQGASLGFAAGWCWALTRSRICFWDLTSGNVITRQLPFQVDQRTAYVAAVHMRSGLSALLITENGDSVLWDTVGGGQDPFVSRIGGVVTSVVAVATQTDGLLAAVGCADGGVQLLRAFPGARV